jgi:hypothetical protein
MIILYRDRFTKANYETMPIRFALSVLEEEYKDVFVTLIVEEGSQAAGHYSFPKSNDPDNLITYNPDKAYKEEWNNADTLVTLPRLHTKRLMAADLPEVKRRELAVLIDITHEIGHFKYHNDADGKSTIDREKYKSDLSYRLAIEAEAEQEVERIARKYGFWDIINRL